MNVQKLRNSVMTEFVKSGIQCIYAIFLFPVNSGVGEDGSFNCPYLARDRDADRQNNDCHHARAENRNERRGASWLVLGYSPLCCIDVIRVKIASIELIRMEKVEWKKSSAVSGIAA